MSTTPRTYGTQKKTLDELKKIASELISRQQQRHSMSFGSQRIMFYFLSQRGDVVRIPIQEDYDDILRHPNTHESQKD